MYYGLSKYVYNEKNCNSPFYIDPCFNCKLTSCEGCILKEEEYGNKCFETDCEMS